MNMRYLNLFLLTFILLPTRTWAADAPKFVFVDEECDADFTVRAVVVVGRLLPPRSEARLAFNYRDDNNHYLIHVSRETVELLKVQDGKPTRLYAPAPFKTYKDNSLHLTLKRRGAKMTLIVNGIIAARVEDATFSGGKVGVSSSGMLLKPDAVRVQPSEPVFFGDDFTRAGKAGEWEDLTPNWGLSRPQSSRFDPSATSNPFAYRATGEAHAMTLAGRWFWDNYSFDAAAKADSDGSIGLIVYAQDGYNYILFRWFSKGSNAPQNQAKQLIAVVNGQAQTLDTQPGGFEPGQWYKLTVKVNDEKILTFIDDEPACRSTKLFFGQGKIGLYSQFCREAQFDDVVVKPWDGSTTQTSSFSEEPKVSPDYIGEDTMAKWTTPALGWMVEDSNTAWHRDNFYGDAALAIRLTNLYMPGALMLCLHSPTTDFHQGYTWRLQIVPLERSAQWELWRQGTTVAKGKQEWEENSPSIGLTFFRAGQQIIGYVAGQRAFSFTDAAPLAGRRVGFFTNGIPLTFNNVRASSTHLIDETFATAPTRWWQGRGVWTVEPRWPCDERWAWMTGGDAETPILWSKSAFSGDVTVDLFAAIQMDANESPVGYKRPSDINVTICGDGKDLGSGYSFIFAGWRNTQTAILRQGKVVASTTEARLVQPSRLNNDFHRHWYHVRITKRKSLVQFYVDDLLVCEYDDEKPLPAGRVAFWTFKNGLVIARARIAYENTAPAEPFPSVLRPPSSSQSVSHVKIASSTDGVFYDFEGPLHGWNGQSKNGGAVISLDSSVAARSRQSLKIQNPISGGDFLAWTTFAPLDLEKNPVLRFDYRLPPTVKVNLIVRVNGSYFIITFTGGDQPDDRRPTIGSIQHVAADIQWHTAEINLFNALRSRFPTAPSFTIDGVAFSCPDETYLRCGIGGNYWGSAFHVDNFRVAPASREQ